MCYMTTRRQQSSICMTTLRKTDRRAAPLLFVLCLLSACFPSTATPDSRSQAPVTAPQLVRPFGAGLDGQVIRVTTLAGGGAGSLRRAIETEGPRLIVFDVAGVIDLGGRTLTVRHPHVTIAGQTAPDPGITLIRGSLVVETNDVVVQHIAVRPGDEGPEGKEWAPDAMGVRGAAPH